MYTLITGGSSGLGFEIAKELIAKGKNVIVTGRNHHKLQSAVRELENVDGKADVLAYRIDLEDEQAVKMMYASFHEENLTIESLYNVAGSGFYGKLEVVSKDDIMTVLNSNMIGLMLATIEVIKYFDLHPAKRHQVVSVLSTAALKGKSNETVYNAAKHGARGFLLSVEDEVKDRNIDILRVYPGGMRTPFWDTVDSGYPVDTFMEAETVARQIVNVSLSEGICVSDLTINRPKG